MDSVNKLQASVPRWGNKGIFLLHHRLQTSSGSHIVSYPVGTEDSFPGSKVARRGGG
jgi:hypothetical protein